MACPMASNPTLLVLSPGPLATPRLRWARSAGLEIALVDPAPAGRFHGVADSVHGFDPVQDTDAVVALAEELRERGPLEVVPSRREHLAVAAAITGFALQHDPPAPRLHAPQSTLEANGFFRADGSFVAAGIVERWRATAGRPEMALAPALGDATDERTIYATLEELARTRGWIRGPVHACGVLEDGRFEVVDAAPLFLDDPTTVCLAPLAFGRSPWQAWFASLIDAGGPFDGLPEERRFEGCAGWIAVRCEDEGPLHAVHGCDVARRVPGIEDVSLVATPGRELAGDHDVVAYAWGSAASEEELKSRLMRAHDAVGVELAARQIA